MNNLKQIVLAAGVALALGAVANVQASGKPVTAGGGGGAVGVIVNAPTVVHGIAIAPAAHGGGGGGNAAPVVVHGITVTQVNGKTVVTKVPGAAGL